MKLSHVCRHCGKKIPGRAGLWCEKKRCQAAKRVHKRAVEKAWVLKHKPWLKKKDQMTKLKIEAVKGPVRYCHYRYCNMKKAPLPQGWFLYHPHCHKRLSEIYGAGIDVAEGAGLPLREG